MNIQTTKVGNTIICNIGGELFQRTFNDDLELINIYEQILNVKDGDVEAVEEIKEIFVPNITAQEQQMQEEFEEAKKEAEYNADLVDFMKNCKNDPIFRVLGSQIFMKGIDIPIPQFLASELVYNYQRKADLKSSEMFSALCNFWKLCVLNPNTRCREDLYGFLKKNKMTITPSGCFVAYRNVNLKQEGNLKENQAIAQEWVKLKAEKKDPNDYAFYAKYVMQDGFPTDEIDKYYSVHKHKKFASSVGSDEKVVQIPDSPLIAQMLVENGLADSIEAIPTKSVTTYNNLDDTQDPYKGHVCLGNVQAMYDALSDLDNPDATIYTDGYSGRMTIRLGDPVAIPRQQCDSNADATCSRGLHAANSEWLKGGYFGEHGLGVLINPMNVVACPYADSGKLRCCEYVPVSVIEYDDDKNVIPFEYELLDLGYYEYNQKQLEDLLDTSKFTYSRKQDILPPDIDFAKYTSLVSDLRSSLVEMTIVTKGRIKDI